MARLGIAAHSVAFQSRLGRIPWIRPFTDEVLVELAKGGVRRLAVLCPSFTADCLETLEEIEGENQEHFMHHGGEKFAYVPCLNDSEPGMDVIRAVVERELQGWMRG